MGCVEGVYVQYLSHRGALMWMLLGVVLCSTKHATHASFSNTIYSQICSFTILPLGDDLAVLSAPCRLHLPIMAAWMPRDWPQLENAPLSLFISLLVCAKGMSKGGQGVTLTLPGLTITHGWTPMTTSMPLCCEL